MKKCAMLVAAALMAAAGSSVADTQALSNFTPGGVAAAAGYTTFGWSFWVSSRTRVTSLSVWDYQGDGFYNEASGVNDGTEDVGIWTDTGTLVGFATVSSTDTLSADGFRSVDVPDFYLEPGMAYVVGATTDYYAYGGTGNWDVNYMANAVGGLGESGLACPDSSVSASGISFIGGNFSTTTVPTPTASIAGFASLAGLGGVGLIKRRRAAKAE
jgi:hypothetical protein